jgi:hypothetical protein
VTTTLIVSATASVLVNDLPRRLDPSKLHRISPPLADAALPPVRIPTRRERLRPLMQQHVVGVVLAGDEVRRPIVPLVAVEVMHDRTVPERMSDGPLYDEDVLSRVVAVRANADVSGRHLLTTASPTAVVRSGQLRAMPKKVLTRLTRDVATIRARAVRTLRGTTTAALTEAPRDHQ